MVYIPSAKKAVMYGGRNASGILNDQYYYTYSSSGIYESSGMDVPFSTSLQWKKLYITQSDPTYENTLKFQIGSSTDNINYTFTDLSGTVNATKQYISGTTTYAILCSTHTDKRFFKYRLFFEAINKPPNSQKVNSVVAGYNLSPFAPGLYNPIDGGATNFYTPKFTWSNAVDSDGDTLTYFIQVSKNINFSSPIIHSTGIISGSGSYSSYNSTTSLTTGKWYWRVKASDGTDSLWSNSFALNVDTTPPRAVTDLRAQTASTNGAVKLSWTSPGNDGGTGSIINGAYKIWFSNQSLVTSTATATGKRIGSYSTPSNGDRAEVTVTGLSDNTVYYFALRIADQAGNYSLLSTTSPSALTNAPPTVTLLAPKGAEQWNKNRPILWQSADANVGDTRTFNIYLSTNSGVSYDTIISQNLPFGTTSYNWDTRAVKSDTVYRIKVIATDASGLTGFDSSSSNFTIFNENEPPVVTIIYPNGGESLTGSPVLKWSVIDPNKTDTHTYDIYVSSDSGNTFFWHFTSTATFYTLDTRQFHNRTTYRIKVMATDSGLGHLTGSSVSSADFSINNLNSPPSDFSLVYPLNNESRSVIGFTFQWENNGDPNGDAVTYTVYFSTDSNFLTSKSVGPIANNYCGISPLDLAVETTYYWKVKAIDAFGAWTWSLKTFKFMTLNRFKAESIDGTCNVQITQGLPANGYITIEKISQSGNLSIALANQDTKGNRHLKALNGDVYQMTVYDINQQILNVADPVVSLSMKYTDNNSDGYLDNTLVKKENLNVGYLDAAKNQWEISKSLAALNDSNKSISVTLNSIGLVTMLAATNPTSAISSVINYPNPFAAGKQSTRIRYVLIKDDDVTTSIYTLIGGLVLRKTYSSGTEGAKGQVSGYTNEITWDGKNDSGQIVANGMYILEIKTGSERFIRKIGVVK
jgi:hypothetical protein